MTNPNEQLKPGQEDVNLQAQNSSSLKVAEEPGTDGNKHTNSGVTEQPPQESLGKKLAKTFTFDLPKLNELFPPRQKKLPKAQVGDPTNLITRRKALVVIGSTTAAGVAALACGALPRAPALTPEGQKSSVSTQEPTAKPIPKDTPAPFPKPPEVLKDPPPALLTEKNLTDAMSNIGGEGSITVTPSPDAPKEITVLNLTQSTSTMWGEDFNFEALSKDPVAVLKLWTTLLEAEGSKEYGVKKIEGYFPTAKSSDGQGIHLVRFANTDKQEHKLVNGLPVNYPLREGTKPTIIGVTQDKKNAIIATSLYDQRDGHSHLSFVSIPIGIQPGEMGYSLTQMVTQNGWAIDTTRPDGIYLTIDKTNIPLNFIDTPLADKLTAEAGSAFFDTDKSTGKPFANHIARAPSAEFIASLSLKKGDTPTIVADFPNREVDMFAPDPSGSGKGTVVVARQTYDQKTNEWVWNAEKPKELPVLRVEGSKFVEVDGKEVVLRGAVANHGIYDNALEVFTNDIDWMKLNGANFVIIQWNSGFLNKPGYIEKIVKMVEYAKKEGMRVGFSLHSRGLKPNSTWEPQQITVADDQIITDWDNLLSDPSIAKRLAGNADFFGMISELEKNKSGNYVTWSEAKNIESAALSIIRQKLNKPDAICAFSPPGFAGDLRGVINDIPNISNSIIDVHPYQWVDKIADFETNAEILRKKGILILAGEFGHDDPIPFTEGEYQFMERNGMSFAVYAINSSSDYPNGLYIKGGIVTERGKLAIKYWNEKK